MRKVFLSVTMLLLVSVGSAQIQNPVHWSYSAKKIDATTYEVHLTAAIGNGWHTYSQTTPEGGPVQTTISFSKNPLVTIQGTAKEVGVLQQKHEPLFGVDVKQFSGKVDFVQIVKLKMAVKTTVTGSIEFMVCNDKQCLPPSAQNFSVALK